MAPSPVVARWELSRRLATRRKDLGLDVKAITNELGFTRNYWSAVENDRTLLAEDKLRQLCDLLDFTPEERDELLQIREESRKKGWWDEYPTLDDDAKRFYGMEAGADQIRAYDGHLIPGPLQIPEYSRALFEADPFSSAVDIEPRLAVRRRRQFELLRGRSDPLAILLSEAALRQRVGGQAVQLRQLQYVLDLIEQGSVDVRVLPFASNPGMIISASTLILLGFESVHLGGVAYQEAVLKFGAIEQADERYRALETAWADGLARSLDGGASRLLLADIVRSLE